VPSPTALPGRCTRTRAWARGAATTTSSPPGCLPFLRLIRTPTLVIAGDDDPIIPSINARVMARLIPHSELYLYEGGHLALVTEAAEHTPVVERFLDR
jgi:pimeloyl-ACP methyl ester carboxylesterase